MNAEEKEKRGNVSLREGEREMYDIDMCGIGNF